MEAGVYYKLIEVYEKLQSESDIQNEIVFFMHNWLTSDRKNINSHETLPCVRLICKHLLIKFQSAEELPKDDSSILLRVLSALNDATYKNTVLLGSLVEEFHLHKCLISILKSAKSNVYKLALKLIKRLIWKDIYCDQHCRRFI